MFLAINSKYGAISPTPFKYGGTVTTGDVVYVDGTAGTVKTCASNATAALGVASDSGASGDIGRVIEAYPGVRFKATYAGTFAQTMIGKHFGLTVTAGDPIVNLADTTNKLFKLIGQELSPDGKAYVIVEIAVGKSQAMNEVV